MQPPSPVSPPPPPPPPPLDSQKGLHDSSSPGFQDSLKGGESFVEMMSYVDSQHTKQIKASLVWGAAGGQGQSSTFSTAPYSPAPHSHFKMPLRLFQGTLGSQGIHFENPYSHPCRWGQGGPERSPDLLKVTQGVRGRGKAQAAWRPGCASAASSTGQRTPRCKISLANTTRAPGVVFAHTCGG